MVVVSEASSGGGHFRLANSEIRRWIDGTDILLLKIPLANLNHKAILPVWFMCWQFHLLAPMEFQSPTGALDCRTFCMNYSDAAFTFQESQETADACSGPLLTAHAWGEESSHPATARRRNWLTSFERKWVSIINWASVYSVTFDVFSTEFCNIYRIRVIVKLLLACSRWLMSLSREEETLNGFILFSAIIILIH